VSVEVETVRTVEVPTRIVHGAGAIARVGELVAELGVIRPLLVTDKGVAAAGLVDATLAHLENAVLFDEVCPNPDIELVGRASVAYSESGCDGLVALGGGSSMDTAKSVGVECRLEAALACSPRYGAIGAPSRSCAAAIAGSSGRAQPKVLCSIPSGMRTSVCINSSSERPVTCSTTRWR
jgi:alcohol dehydrogenase class IV